MNSTDIDPVLLANEALRVLSVRMEAAPDDIPSGALMRLVEQLCKVELARLQAQPKEEKQAEPSVADILSLGGLPRQRRLELLREQDARLGAEHAQIQLAIQELEVEETDEVRPESSAAARSAP